ncbi:MAG: diguanylate cyclase [Erysipelotrichales bacterium]|nr:MAG: diguanylate cyclase [Erysipelotrichales bacterium]
MVIDKHYMEMLEYLYEGVYFVDKQRTITYWNKGAEKITGYSAVEVKNRKCYENILNHKDEGNNSLCHNGCTLHATIGDGNQREAHVYLQHKKGHRVPVTVRTMPVFDENNQITGAIEIFIDDKNEAKILSNLEQYRKEASEDQLTGLSNRRYIKAVMEAKLIEFNQLNTSFGIAFIDIDHFKHINDEYGHDIGDEILKLVANTLESNLRRHDMVGRWGGEEFIVVFSNIDAEGLAIVTEKMRFLVEASKLRMKDKEIHVTISIGATISLPGDDIEGMVKRSDELMYQSKMNGRNIATIG